MSKTKRAKVQENGGNRGEPPAEAPDAPGSSRVGRIGRRPGRPPSAASSKAKSRHTFEFYPETNEMLERVRRRTCSATANEAVRKALTLLDRHLSETEAGAHAVYERADGTRIEIVVV